MTNPSSVTKQPVTTGWSVYEARIERVIAYIHEHMDEPLDLDHLADVACLSRFHWHRIYRAVSGETVSQTLRRVRLARAGFDLSRTDTPLPEIARRSGYPNVRSFTRAFKSAYGVPPGEYRRVGGHNHFVNAIKDAKNAMNTNVKLDYPVEIKPLDRRVVAGIMHTGSYFEINKTFETLYGTLATRGATDAVKGMVGIYYDDPMAMPEAELRSCAGVFVDEDFNFSAPLQKQVLEAGPHATLLHKGPYSDLPAAYDWFYSVWLKDNGHAIRAQPPFEVYLNNPREVQPSELLTEISIPVEA
ncbi:MAG: AraC family transcriptional regulator [Pseudomonadota bacterium]